MFLKNAIEKILNDPTTKKNAELKKACESALVKLQAEIERQSKQLANQDVLPHHRDFILADEYFHPFELACQSRNQKTVTTALDCLQKLIAAGHLIGDSRDSANPEQLLIDRIVKAICFPFQGPNTDDQVQLQIIKAILALVLSNTCKVHGGSLLDAVKTCFNIYLASKNLINQSTAKGILTQTISTVFANMERMEHDGHTDIEVETDETVIKSVVDSIVYQVSMQVDAGADEKSRRSSTVSSGTALPNGYMASLTSVDGTVSHDGHHDEPSGKLEFKSADEKDAFLIFRALCKLSEKPLPENADPRSHELRSKLLSLEMILLILQNLNVQLPEKHSFIYAIRHHLCVALTQNAASLNIDVFEKALAIFVELVGKFKMYLKRQIEVFFKEIVISILDSTSSSFEHKWAVLNAVSKICDNSQSVVDIYINYDCHLTSANIFEGLISHVSKIASGSAIEVGTTTPHDQRDRQRRMRILGLESLVKVLECLVVWYEDLHIGKSGDPSTSGAITGGDTEELTNGGDTLSVSVGQLKHVKQQKGIIEHGIDLFARKPKQGLAFLQEKGIIGKEPADIAQFFFTEERLDKTVVGDFLGDGDEFHKTVMYAYIDRFDFSDLTLVQALRQLLDKFRLPGEAQKIDRLMEKFASRYCECNPGLNLFASADTAYVLSYSIIMLTTDLHSPQVRNKMTKEQYIAMNRGINDQSDLPEDFLSAIYDDIAANEIKMKPGAFKRPKLDTSVATWRQRKLFQNLELQSISQTAAALMEAASYASVEFTSATHYEHVRPMFSLVWHPCLAAFSIGLQSSDDPEIWQLCLDGFKYGVRVACVFRMDTERNAFVQALTRFTLLTAKNSLTEIKQKNVESIKLLITIGDENGEFLDECWYDVLKCISQLELAQFLSTGAHPESIKDVFNVDIKSLSTLQECLGETSSQSVVVAVDKIFQGSSKLSGDAIVHFVRALCSVSAEELALKGNPRMFMLQKIVEISFYNMSRIRLEWSMIWAVLGKHFNMAGCSANENVSHFALDALKQLSMKFLEKGELPNFRFQKDFLRPFEDIMVNNGSLECREMILACLDNMVKSHARRIRSGWKNIFSVFTMVASERREVLVEAAFRTTSDVITNVLPEHFMELMGSFHEAIKCLSDFACNNHFPDISMESIRLIRLAATLVSDNAELISTQSSDDDQHTKPTETQLVWDKGWCPIFFELSRIIDRCKLDVRTRSLTVMFEIVKTYGEGFRPEWWNVLFEVIFQIFNFSKLNKLGNEKGEWMMTTCNHALYAIVDVFSQYFSSLEPILLESLYQQLLECVKQGNEQLARSAINCVENLIVSNGERFSPHIWDRSVKLLAEIFECSKLELDMLESLTPTVGNGSLVNGDGASPASENPSPMRSATDAHESVMTSPITRCLMQLEVVDAVSSILFGRNAFKVEGPVKKSTSSIEMNGSVSSDDFADYPKMYKLVSQENLLQLADCLEKSHLTAREFNMNPAHRTIIWKAALKGNTKPNLLKQETHAIHCALNILFHLYAEAADAKAAAHYKNELIKWTDSALDHYLSLKTEQNRSAWLPVLQMIMNRTHDLPEERFRELGTSYQLSLTRMIESEEPPIIRSAIRRVVDRALAL